MRISECFPAWEKLEGGIQRRIEDAARLRTVRRGENVHNGAEDCTGLLLIRAGQLRVYAISEEGREITLYRLLERDVCLFSASCMIHDLQLDLAIQAERETEFWLIPADIYKELMEESAALANFTNQLMAGRFSEVMWLMNEVLWKRFDQRLAAFLLEESALEGTSTLHITHETIGNHLGTAREVVTRMLNYFRDEGLVRLARGTVEIVDAGGLDALRA